MQKRSIFGGRLLPYALLAPQLAVTLVFFYWPASQAVWQSFLLEDAFGLGSGSRITRPSSASRTTTSPLW